MLARVATLAVALALAGCGATSQMSVSEPQWRFAQSMSQRRSYSATAEVDGHIYVAGGMVGNAGRFLALFQRYDPVTDSWTTLAPLPEPARAASAAVLGGRL
jgi:N-acetylneuraminic acid mutarotase